MEVARILDQTWNGFAIPGFNRDQLAYFIDQADETGFFDESARDSGVDERWTLKGDRFLVETTLENDTGSESYSHETGPDDEGLYWPGDGWTWTRVSPFHTGTRRTVCCNETVGFHYFYGIGSIEDRLVCNGCAGSLIGWCEVCNVPVPGEWPDGHDACAIRPRERYPRFDYATSCEIVGPGGTEGRDASLYYRPDLRDSVLEDPSHPSDGGLPDPVEGVEGSSRAPAAGCPGHPDCTLEGPHPRSVCGLVVGGVVIVDETLDETGRVEVPDGYYPDIHKCPECGVLHATDSDDEDEGGTR